MESRNETEKAIVRGAFSGHDELDRIACQIEDTDFENIDLRRIFGVLKKLSEAGQEFDPVIVLEEMTRTYAVQTSVGIHVLTDLSSSPWEASHVDHYCKILRQYAARDQAHTIGQQLASEQSISADTIDQYITKLDQIKRGHKDEISTAQDAVIGLAERKANPRTTHATGIQEIDSRIGGLRDGQIITIGGRPGTGKSILLTQIAVGIAERGEGALIVSLEMLKEEIADRLSRTRTSENIASLPLYFIDTTSDLGTIVALIRVACRRFKIGVVAIDYLQLAEVPNTRNDNRERQIATISRRLKRLAMDLQIPILVGSQLNRESAKRGKPSLADLRESGAIEQDSDIVLLLSKSDDGPESIIDVAKQRGGSTGEITMRMNGAKFRFESNYEQYDRV